MKKNLLAFILALNLLAVPALAFSVSPAKAANLNLWGENYNANDFQAETGLGQRDPRDIVARVIRIILGFLGIVAVIIILLGGFKWMTAAGNEDKVAEARKLIISGVIGLVIIMAAFGIAQFVINGLMQATNN
ncbi:MAG: pilin [Candidatus Falkowbacteria bacterium]|nr:pilin [Candidatus Falkowbacteria bacterium]